jgi:hypothetical protein
MAKSSGNPGKSCGKIVKTGNSGHIEKTHSPFSAIV